VHRLPLGRDAVVDRDEVVGLLDPWIRQVGRLLGRRRGIERLPALDDPELRIARQRLVQDGGAGPAVTEEHDGLLDHLFVDLRILLEVVLHSQPGFEIDDELRAREQAARQVQVRLGFNCLEQRTEVLDPAVVAEVIQPGVAPSFREQ
jgi:hypothetical protein